jgi:hypothetical protein
MKTLHSSHPSALRLSFPFAATMLTFVLFAGFSSVTAQAQPGPAFVGPGPGPELHRELRIERDQRGAVLIRNGHDAFHFVELAPAGRHIERRDVLLDLLLHPGVNAFVWGLGDVANLEMAAMLGLPVRTVLYGVEPGVVVYSGLPPGYTYAEALPANVALVSSGPAGPMVLVPNVPPGAYMAYQAAPNGAVVGQCVVVPQAMPVPVPVPMPQVPVPTPPVYNSNPTSTQPPATGNTGTVVYDANHNPIGVLITNPDGSKTFVPVGK